MIEILSIPLMPEIKKNYLIAASFRGKIDAYMEILSDYNERIFSIGLTEKDRIEMINLLKRIYNSKKKKYSGEFEKTKSGMETWKPEVVNGYKIYKEGDFGLHCYTAAKYENRWLTEYFNEIDLIEKELYKMVRLLYDNVHTINIREFMKNNSILMHLFYTNNKYCNIKMSSVDSYLFVCPCQPLESQIRHSTMHINNSRNFAHCFKCGNEFDPIEYFMEIEELTEEEAISQLASIYNINYSGKGEPIPEIQAKYKNTLTSDEFKKLLEYGYNRLKRNRNKIPNIDKLPLVEYALEKFEKYFKTIERVKNNEYEQFVFEEKPKTFVLKY